MTASTTAPGAYGSGRADKGVIDMQQRPEPPGVLGSGNRHIPRVIVESVFHTNTSLGGNPPGGVPEFNLLRDGLNWTNDIDGSVNYDGSTTDGDGVWWGFLRASQSIRYGISDYRAAQKEAP